MQPARASGLLRFDVGVAATAVAVDSGAAYWKGATTSDFTTSGYVAVPRLVVSKGMSGMTISGSYAKLGDTNAKTYGGTVDIPVMRGSIAMPEIAVRGSYARLTGVEEFRQKVYGLEAFISKGFGPVMPYGAVGRVRTNATGTIPSIGRVLTDRSDFNRYTAGVRFSLLVPKIAIEVTQAEVRSYAAKISFGL